MASTDDSLKEPMANYVTKLLVLEAIKCTQRDDHEAVVWIQRVMHHLIIRWEELKGPK